MTARRRSVDVEELVRWAVAQSGRLPWVRDTVLDLTMNRYTARPRRRQCVGWALTEIYAGLRLTAANGRVVAVRSPARPLEHDARIVLDAVMGLADGGIAGIVLAHARARTRPECWVGTVPVLVERKVYPKRKIGRRVRKAHRPVIVREWEPCAPEVIRASRAEYSRWYAALWGLGVTLSAQLNGWQINGFAAPARPWGNAAE